MPEIRSASDALNRAQRMVIKIGSALLVDRETGQLRAGWLTDLCAEIARLKAADKDVIIVSSGAISLGRSAFPDQKGALTLEFAQASAAIGQIRLAQAFSEHLATHSLSAAQILVTLDDTTERRRYLNMQATINTLLENGIVPVVNENDTVATDEIRYGDNDRLAARLASSISADLLVLFSDVDGLYSANPQTTASARHIAIVHDITPDVEAMASASTNLNARGGMQTKLMAARIATQAGCHMIIAAGIQNSPLRRMNEGARSTLFLAKQNPVQARKAWIGGMKPKGKLVVDSGAIKALSAGRSLLPVGVSRIEGQFDRGDAVEILNMDQKAFGIGLTQYSSADTEKILGLSSSDINQALGYPARSSLVHRDDLVLHPSSRSGNDGS